MLILDAAGAGLALLAAGRAWLRLTAARQAPLPDVTATLSGKAVEPLVPALGVVALAGLVALLATRGRARQGVGALLAACGALLAIRALGRIAGPSQAAALGLLGDADKASGVSPGTAITVTTSPIWPVLATVAGIAMLAGGVVVVLRSRHWPGMSARYDGPATASRAASRAASPAPEAVWDALDRGDDPTAS